jgi:hypothetical protein
MLTFLLSVGVLAGTPAPVVIRGGDDADWRQSFYDRQIAEVERLIKRLEPKKRRKAKPAAVAAEAIEVFEALPPVIVEDATLRLRQSVQAAKQSASDVIAVLQAVAERARREQARKRKRRQEDEFFLMYVL